MEISEYFDIRSAKSSITLVITGLIMIAISGLFFALIYFFMNTIQNGLLATNCTIEGNVFFDDCQGMWTLVVYPFLNLKIVLVYLSFFSIFILTIGMLLMGYQSGTKPYFLGVYALVELLIVYGSIHVANIYRTLLENEVIRNAMIQFDVYNTIMLYFPWFVFIISLFSLILGIVNWQKSPTNKVTDELDY
jgi:hypothetical protein